MDSTVASAPAAGASARRPRKQPVHHSVRRRWRAFRIWTSIPDSWNLLPRTGILKLALQ